jgi:hypothetical protein
VSGTVRLLHKHNKAPSPQRSGSYVGPGRLLTGPQIVTCQETSVMEAASLTSRRYHFQQEHSRPVCNARKVRCLHRQCFASQLHVHTQIHAYAHTHI